MRLSNLYLLNYRNYSELDAGFSPQVNVTVGANGSGKTNLLEAIYTLCMARGYSLPLDSDNVRHGESYFMVRGNFTTAKDSHETITCSYRAGKKTMLHGKKPYPRLSDHIGRFPCVFIAPNDTDLIRGGSEGRRKLLDSIIAQSDQGYLRDLMAINRLLRQRNAHLSQLQQRESRDVGLLDTYDDKLIPLMENIHAKRSGFLASFSIMVGQNYALLSAEDEEVGLEHVSQLHDDGFAAEFRGAHQRDIVAGRTTMGVHRDDMEFSLAGTPMRRYGSQGQQKTFVIALKMAMYRHLHEATGKRPLLLLDDIFDKLDDRRIAALLDMITGEDTGQVFITDARPERTKSFFKELELEIAILEIQDGKLKNAQTDKT